MVWPKRLVGAAFASCSRNAESNPPRFPQMAAFCAGPLADAQGLAALAHRALRCSPQVPRKPEHRKARASASGQGRKKKPPGGGFRCLGGPGATSEGPQGADLRKLSRIAKGQIPPVIPPPMDGHRRRHADRSFPTALRPAGRLCSSPSRAPYARQQRTVHRRPDQDRSRLLVSRPLPPVCSHRAIACRSAMGGY